MAFATTAKGAANAFGLHRLVAAQAAGVAAREGANPKGHFESATSTHGVAPLRGSRLG